MKPEGLLKQSLPAMSAVLWTPRKQAALIRLFNPWYYVSPNISPMARKAQLRQLLGSMAVLGTTVSLFKMAGYDVETNPIATNFMRVGSGITQFDFTQGGTAYLRFYARFLTGYTESSAGNITKLGEGYKPTTTLTLAGDMLRSRLIPWAGNLASALHGEDPAGRPFGVPQFLSNTLVPMTAGQLIELAVEDPDNVGAIILSPLTLFGVGMQVQSFNKPKGRWDVWGDPVGTDHSDSPVVQKLEELGVELNMPANMIRGVKLTPEQYDAYSYISGIEMQLRTGAVIEMPGFDEASPGEQETMLRAAIAGAREDARMDMMGQYPELMDEADRLQQLRIQQGSPAAVRRREAAQ
jgi:hypothetical protein